MALKGELNIQGHDEYSKWDQDRSQGISYDEIQAAHVDNEGLVQMLNHAEEYELEGRDDFFRTIPYERLGSMMLESVVRQTDVFNRDYISRLYSNNPSRLACVGDVLLYSGNQGASDAVDWVVKAVPSEDQDHLLDLLAVNHPDYVSKQRDVVYYDSEKDADVVLTLEDAQQWTAWPAQKYTDVLSGMIDLFSKNPSHSGCNQLLNEMGPGFEMAVLGNMAINAVRQTIDRDTAKHFLRVRHDLNRDRFHDVLEMMSHNTFGPMSGIILVAALALMADDDLKQDLVAWARAQETKDLGDTAAPDNDELRPLEETEEEHRKHFNNTTLPFVDETNFDSEVVDEKRLPVVVAFVAGYCGACKRSLPTLEALSARGKVKVVLVDIEATEGSRELYEKCKGDQNERRNGIPMFAAFVKGKKQMAPILGFGSPDEFKAQLKALLPKGVIE